MTDQNSFEGKVVRKIPYLTKTFLTLACTFSVIFIAGCIPLYLTDNSTQEFQTIVFMELYQGILGDITFSCLFVAIVFFILYEIRLKTKDILTLDKDNINVSGCKYNNSIDTVSIKEVRCHDHLNYRGVPKNKFSLMVVSNKKNFIFFVLKNYQDANNLFDTLVKYEIKLEVYNDSFGEDNDNE